MPSDQELWGSNVAGSVSGSQVNENTQRSTDNEQRIADLELDVTAIKTPPDNILDFINNLDNGITG